jgi:hypothetical protein
MEAVSCTTIKGRKYTVRSINVTGSTNSSVAIPPYCNSWIAENYGTSVAFINNKPLRPPPAANLSGESWGPNGNDGDIYAGEIIVQFAAGGVNDLWISFYIYTS